MRPKREEIDWTEFLERPRLEADPELASSLVGKSVMITGAGGSIGAGLARTLSAGGPQILVLLDLSEGGLYECCRKIAGLARSSRTIVAPLVGSVGDGRLIESIVRRHGVDLIFHAAAYKHVPLMERNPFSAIVNNAIGTGRLAAAAGEAGVSGLTVVSTDKAVNPRSIMGASKRIAELVALSHSTGECRMNAIRLGNVLGSSGSVVPIFCEQLERGLPLTVSHPEVTRYFLTPNEAEAAILAAAGSPVSGKILVAECGDARRVVDLARYLGRRLVPAEQVEPLIEYIGLRPGDKLSEELVAKPEEVVLGETRGLWIVSSPHAERSEVISGIERLAAAADKDDLEELLAAIAELVPSYRPSSALTREPILLEAP
jgi:FlaA1/EpsC-like NDP-sugar epimerase